MSLASLRTRVVHLATDLAGRGFVADGPFRLGRTRPNIHQFVEIQPGHKQLEGYFTCNLCWKLTADGIPTDDVYDQTVRIGNLLGQGDVWLSHRTKAELDCSYQQLKTLLDEHGLPFLDRLGDLGRMIELYEAALPREPREQSNSTSPLLFFGEDEGWKHYNLGFAYKALGNSEKAREHLLTVIEKLSDAPFAWVEDRRRLCLNALANL